MEISGKYKMSTMSTIFVLLLILRSSLDIFTNLSIGPLKFNIPAFWALVVLLVGILYFLLRWKIASHPISKIFAVWIAFLIIPALISFINFGPLGGLAAREFVRVFTMFFIFNLFFNLPKTQDMQNVISYLFLSLIIPVVVSLYQVITGTGLYIEQLNIYRAYGTFAHPNSFALFLVLFITLSIWMLIKTKNKIWYMAIIVQLVCLVFTFSFSGFLLLILVFSFLVLKLKISQKLLLGISIVSFLFIFINTNEFKIRWERIKKIDLKRTIEQQEVVDSFTWRVVNWMNLFNMWKEKPILGYGLQSVEIINPWKTTEGVGYGAHNDYLKFLVETGLIGFLIYLIFVVKVGCILYKEVKDCKQKELQFLLYILFSFFVSHQIVSGVDNYITVTAFQVYYWAILGLSLNLNR